MPQRSAPSPPESTGGVDFTMRYDRWAKPFATLIGLGPKRTLIRLDDNGQILRVRHGRAFHLNAPYRNIGSIEPLKNRPLAWGVHSTGDFWLVNESRDGIVSIAFRPPVELPKVPMAFGPIHKLMISLVEVDEFISAVQARI